MKPEKLEDFGVKIGGARKDLRGRVRAEDLEGATVEEIQKWATKDYIWPTPDYAVLADDLPEDERHYVVRAIKLVRDSLPASASATLPSATAAYVAGVAALRDAFAEVKSRRDLRLIWDKPEVKTHAAIVALIDIPGGERVLVSNIAIPAGWALTRARRRTFSDDSSLVNAIEAGLKGTIPSRSVLGREMRLNPRWPQKLDAIDRKLAKERLGVELDKNGVFRVSFRGVVLGRDDVDYTSYLRRRMPELSAVLERTRVDGWAFRSDASAALRAPYEAKAKATTEAKRADRAAQKAALAAAEGGANATVIDWLDGRAAVPVDYIGGDGLRMRAGEFGNWVNERERQELLDSGYNAFRDLADALGVAPDCVSLNGTLAVAFGARGSGPFAGHYESDRQVINLTKPHGFGVLAHEWGHAFDHWACLRVAKHPELGFITRASSSPYLSDRVVELAYSPSEEWQRHVSRDPNDEEGALLELADAAFFLRYKDASPKTPEAYREHLAALHAKHRADLANHLGPADAPPADTFVTQIVARMVVHLVDEQSRRLRRSAGSSAAFLTADQIIEMRRRFGEAALKPAMALAQHFKASMFKGMGREDISFSADGLIDVLRDRHRHDVPMKPVYTWLERYAAYFVWHHDKTAGAVRVFNYSGRLPPPSYEKTAFAIELGKLTEYYQRPREAFARSVETAVAQSLREKGRRSQFLVPIAVADGGKGHPNGEDAARFAKAFLAVVPKMPLGAPRIVDEAEEQPLPVPQPEPRQRAAGL
jgi:hypothetical protein